MAYMVTNPSDPRLVSFTTEEAKYIADMDTAIQARIAALGLARHLNLPFLTAASGSQAINTQAEPEAFLYSSNRNILAADLTGYTQARLIARINTASASANTPLISAKYHTAFSTTLGDFLSLGMTAITVSLAVAGLIKSSWVDIATAAKADVFLTITQQGGDGSESPSLSHCHIQFR